MIVVPPVADGLLASSGVVFADHQRRGLENRLDGFRATRLQESLHRSPRHAHSLPGRSLAFCVLEKLVLWRHCHEGDCPGEYGRSAPLILVGDAFHNFMDGIVIAAAFLTSVPVIICIPTTDDRGIDASISTHFGRAPWFVIVNSATGSMCRRRS